MVVRLVLKEQEPILFVAVNRNLYLYGTSVYLLGFVKTVKLALSLKILCGDSADVHKIYRLSSADSLSRFKVIVVSRLKSFVLKLNAVNGSKEGGMTAVIRPIGVYHTDLGDCRISIFCSEIITAEADIVDIHRKSELAYHLCKLFLAKADKSVYRCDRGRKLVFRNESIKLLKSSLAALYGVNNVLLYCGELAIADIAVEAINARRANERTVFLRDELNALCRRVCSLVKLSGEIFNREDNAIIIKK